MYHHYFIACQQHLCQWKSKDSHRNFLPKNIAVFNNLTNKTNNKNWKRPDIRNIRNTKNIFSL